MLLRCAGNDFAAAPARDRTASFHRETVFPGAGYYNIRVGGTRYGFCGMIGLCLIQRRRRDVLRR